MDRRRFLGSLGMALALPGAPAVSASPTHSVPLEHADLTRLLEALDSGRITSRSLVRLYRRRLERFDQRGPALRSVLLLNPDLEALAADADRTRLTRSGSPAPLHGLPILLKDNLDTADRQPTTAGSLALAGTKATVDATVTRRLRQAKAVILGKTNLSEWANFRSSRSVSGWSSVGGQTRNPYDPRRSPSGSSSGSAVAVAAGFCAAAIGTETDGSIVSPACHASIVGLKPTVGRVSRAGIIPISASQDTAGPMTRTVADAARLLEVLEGPDDRDPATHEAPPAAGGYLRALSATALRGARLGVVRQLFGSHPEVLSAMEAQLAVLRDLGATLVDPVEIPTLNRVGAVEDVVLIHEFKAGIEAYLATREGLAVRTLADLILFNERERERVMPFFGQETFLRSEACGPLTEPRYLEAKAAARRLARDEGIHAALAAHRLDALVAPTEAAPAWLIDPVNGDSYGGGCSTLPAVAGCPHLTVPAGYVRGLPIGLSFFGEAWSESALLAFGHAYEQATQHRRPPALEV